MSSRPRIAPWYSARPVVCAVAGAWDAFECVRANTGAAGDMTAGVNLVSRLGPTWEPVAAPVFKRLDAISPLPGHLIHIISSLGLPGRRAATLANLARAYCQPDLLNASVTDPHLGKNSASCQALANDRLTISPCARCRGIEPF